MVLALTVKNYVAALCFISGLLELDEELWYWNGLLLVSSRLYLIFGPFDKGVVQCVP